MSTTLNGRGRLGNQIIRNLCMSIVAEKHDLKVDYENYEKIVSLGIKLHIGSKIFNNTIELKDENFFDILNLDMGCLKSNLDAHFYFFQTDTIINFLYNYLNSKVIKSKIMRINPYSERYDKNNDCFIHLRLDDAEQWNPGIEYYLKALSLIKFDKLYISSDSINHKFIDILMNKYPNSEKIIKDEIGTIHFASTCRYLVLSHGTFSSIIGYLGFFSRVYYKDYSNIKGWKWHGDTFNIPGWNAVD